MNVLLSGQKAFGAAVLELLLARGHGCRCLLPTGNKRWPPGPALDACGPAGLPLLRSGALSAATMPGGWTSPVRASHDFIGAATRGKTRLGAMGYHPSLLPLHRGRDAVYWTLRMGDKVAGARCTGSRCGRWRTYRRPGWCFTSPATRQAAMAAGVVPLGLRLIAKALGDLDAGLIVSVPQDQALATWEPSVGRPRLPPDLIPIGPAPEGFRMVRDEAAARGEGHACARSGHSARNRERLALRCLAQPQPNQNTVADVFAVGHFLFLRPAWATRRLSASPRARRRTGGQKVGSPGKNHSSAPNLSGFRGCFCNPRPWRKGSRSACAVAPCDAPARCAGSEETQWLASSSRKRKEQQPASGQKQKPFAEGAAKYGGRAQGAGQNAPCQAVNRGDSP
jgi:methionyl-tRNA formyltransferase